MDRDAACKLVVSCCPVSPSSILAFWVIDISHPNCHARESRKLKPTSVMVFSGGSDWPL